MKKHTSKPWRLESHLDHYLIRSMDIQGLMVTKLDSTITDADASLIVAAPDLLEALEAIEARIDGVFDHPSLIKFGPLGTLRGDIRRIVEQAISEAGGRD